VFIMKGTTIIFVQKDGETIVAGDGQVTMGDTVVKHSARKVRRLFDNRVLAGFAGATADAFALFSRFEAKLKEFSGNLERAAVELAKDWRTDRSLRHLEALMLVADGKKAFLLSGTGDIIEPENGLIAIGSGGDYAKAAAEALRRHTDMTAEEIAREAMDIAASICIYTNSNIVLEKLPDSEENRS